MKNLLSLLVLAALAWWGGGVVYESSLWWLGLNEQPKYRSFESVKQITLKGVIIRQHDVFDDAAYLFQNDPGCKIVEITPNRRYTQGLLDHWSSRGVTIPNNLLWECQAGGRTIQTWFAWNQHRSPEPNYEVSSIQVHRPGG